MTMTMAMMKCIKCDDDHAYDDDDDLNDNDRDYANDDSDDSKC